MWINGQIFDKRGRPLSGVIVEALGPGSGAQPRVATSNAGGHYVMCDLRPGTYTMTFTRPGFFTHKRTSLDLANFVATINAELQALEP